MVSPEDMVALHPLLDPTGIVGGLHIPSDGFVLTNHCSVWPTLYSHSVWCVVCGSVSTVSKIRLNPTDVQSPTLFLFLFPPLFLSLTSDL